MTTLKRFDRLVLAVFVGLLPNSSYAQSVVNSFEELSSVVTSGEELTVTDSTGTRVSGKVETISASSIGMLTNGVRREFAATDIQSIRRRSDPLLNGVLWGFGAGAAGGWVAMQATVCSGCHWDPPSFPVQMAMLFGAIGAGAGAGLDALFRHDDLVYARQSSGVRVSMTPQFGKGVNGLRMSVKF